MLVFAFLQIDISLCRTLAKENKLLIGQNKIVVGLNVISRTCLIVIDLQLMWDPKTVHLEIAMNRVVIDAKTCQN